MIESRYPELWQLIRGYFNEDFDMWGSNVEEIVRCYRQEISVVTQNLIMREIEQFRKDNFNNMDLVFKREFGTQFDPELWGYNADSFLDELKRLLQE
ncbi:contact-dependent growth inhibition system immunity protein [Trinickia mobilis]|uniref:contact-dependent growth inhibition system immunity protein n=1 Tax=Trinickia mobilis TaxID=2816356 RepID=UPI001A8F26BF|nr:contact-dependent growth inhibition system immunity protein [Trinickia mobilis]